MVREAEAAAAQLSSGRKRAYPVEEVEEMEGEGEEDEEELEEEEEEEEEDNGGDDADDADDVMTVLDHHVYGGARPGSLWNVYVRVQYMNGKRSNGFVPAERLGPQHRALLNYMRRRKEGRKIVKYLPAAIAEREGLV
jgi:hypothetical protein